MHDHENIVLATGNGISEMGLMWALMAIMFVWNLYMVYQHNKLKKTVAHHCGSQKCRKCENRDDIK
jgi:hypothetical protein